MAPITFSVSYSLREYLSFVRDYLPDGTAAMVADGSLKKSTMDALIESHEHARAHASPS